jgi:glyoxalase/bleomycin resistance protein/dioxygenase superfamily protein
MTALFTDVRQVCTVVGDLGPTVANLSEQLGIGPFRCWHFKPPRLYDTTLRGEPAPWSMKLAITWLDDMQWEVIEPVDGATLYQRHLDEHGRGVQHLLMATGEVRWEEAAQTLAQRGHPFAQTAKLNARVQIGKVTLPPLPNKMAGPMSLQFGYVYAEHTLRSSIELTRYPLGFSERFSLRAGKPEWCIPSGNADFERPLPNRRVGRVAKIALVTRDLEDTVRKWIDVAGVGPWRIFEGIAWGLVGDTLIEIVQPTGGPHAEVLSKRGEGVASVGVLPGRDGFAALAAYCRELYGCPLDRPLVGTHRSTYHTARAAIGTDLEVLDIESPTLLWHNATPKRMLG